MDGMRTAVEQLTWSHDRYGGGTSPYPSQAFLDHQQIAHITDCPAGWSVRLYISYNVPGAHAVFETYDEAVAYIEQWVRGLDIDPGG